MSKVVKIDLKILSPEAFVQALRDVFGEEAVVLADENLRKALEKAARGQGAVRRAYGGQTFRDAVAVVRAGTHYTCRIRREYGGFLEFQGQIPYSDLALVAREDGAVELLADHYTDSRLIAALQTAYVQRVAQSIARRQGRRVSEPVLKEDGTIEIQIR